MRGIILYLVQDPVFVKQDYKLTQSLASIDFTLTFSDS